MTLRTAAFFDVDETLIRVKSMFRFLEFYLRMRGEPDSTYQRLNGELQSAAKLGVPRESINRAYYKFYAGENVRQVTTAGLLWFEHELEEGLFLPETVAELHRHQEANERVLLISGSFFACLDPISTWLGADRAYGTRPLIHRGQFTGEVLTPMIGATKGRVVRAAASVLEIDLASSTAYGDHISDLSMLRAVGHPVVVGDDEVLAGHADRSGWRRLAPAVVR
ncbi:HAD-IB family hydrolase [Streptomyces sp. NBC_00335]|uniref:HAD family hydrolase n=1 Tax=unclassified Streptomyces TaxID=2593676 RepID=UPI00225C25C5|nr:MULTISPECIES: HAD-IB family hydrolase [unclassified Streptomyces]MCX5406588.1 HAD-IB family hydrolase [Streptomyces sp. NBC_00086]